MILRRLNPIPYIKQRISTGINRRVDHVKSSLALIQMPAKLQGTVVEHWAKYWKYLIKDYSAVIAGIFRNAWDRPVRALIVTSGGAIFYHCAQNNPNEEDFLEELRFYSNEMAALPQNMQNVPAKEHLTSLERMQATGQLRHLNIGVASLVWRNDNNPELKTYRANCNLVKSEWSAFGERILDVGFMRRYWRLQKMMKDYDVSE